MVRERVGCERESAEKRKDFEFESGKRTVPASLYVTQFPKDHQHLRPRLERRLQKGVSSSSDLRGGNRGLSHPPWGCGPREPTFSRMGGARGGVTTLFIDGLSSSATNVDLRRLFESVGPVVDAFVSRKARKNNKTAFGFIRYNHGDLAKKAIKNLNGQLLFGRKIRVSWAKYGKGGRPLPRAQNDGGGLSKAQRRILSPALRDNRRFFEVLMGSKNPVSMQVHDGKEAKTKEQYKLNQVIPVLINIRFSDTNDLASKLKLDIVVDNFNNDYGADQDARSNGQDGSHCEKCELNVQAPCLESVDIGEKVVSASNDTVKVLGSTKPIQAHLECPTKKFPDKPKQHQVFHVTTQPNSQERDKVVKLAAEVVNSDVLSDMVVDGESKTVDIDKISSTSEQISMKTLGDIGKSRSCRPRTVKKIMNITDIHNFLGYYGPTKA